MTKWFFLFILIVVYRIAFIFHLLIGLCKDMVPIDFVFTKSKVKVIFWLFLCCWFIKHNFNSMVKPLLCCAFQMWGYKCVNTIELVHNKLCKNILYVLRTTDTCIVLGKCGRLSLWTTYYINCFWYWCNCWMPALFKYFYP